MTIHRLVTIASLFLLGLCISCGKDPETGTQKRATLARAADGNYYSTSCLKTTGSTEGCKRSLLAGGQGRSAVGRNAHSTAEQYFLWDPNQFRPDSFCNFFGGRWADRDQCNRFWGLDPEPEYNPMCDPGFLERAFVINGNSDCGFPFNPWQPGGPTSAGNLVELNIDRHENGLKTFYSLSTQSGSPHGAFRIVKKTCQAGQRECREGTHSLVSPEEYQYLSGLVRQMRNGPPPVISDALTCQAVPTHTRSYLADNGRITVSRRSFPCGGGLSLNTVPAKALVRWWRNKLGISSNSAN